jgi:hypothetical protein
VRIRVKDFFVSEVINKNFQCAFFDNISVTHVFILSKSSGLQRKHPPPPPPNRAVQGVGEKWIFFPISAALVMAMKQ